MAIQSSGSSGGSSGMDMLSGFTQLGTLIHDDSIESMEYFQQLEAANRSRRERAMMRKEDKRRFDEQMGVTKRNQNMAGLDMLRQNRMMADERSRMNTFARSIWG